MKSPRASYWHGGQLSRPLINMLKTTDFEGLTFDKMPQAIEYLVGTVNQLQTLISQHLDNEHTPQPTDRWLNTNDLMEYHPDRPARSTIYSWVANNLIPFHKTGKKLQFRQSEIDEWIKNTRNKTEEEIREEAIDHINRRRIGR